MFVFKLSWLPYLFIIGGVAILSEGQMGGILLILIGAAWLFYKYTSKKSAANGEQANPAQPAKPAEPVEAIKPAETVKPIEPSVPATDKTAETSDPAPKFCPYCGIKLQEGSRFCPACGKKLQ